MSHSPIARRRTTIIAAVVVAAAFLMLQVPAVANAALAPIPGGQSSGDSLFAGIGNTGYDAQHYDVSLSYFEDGTIEATSRMDAVAAQPLSSFSLDFEGLEIEEVVVDGTPATFTRSSDPAIESYKLIITPTTPVAGDFSVEVAYSGEPVTHIDLDEAREGWLPTADGGATALGQPVGTMAWIPVNNTPADKATWDFAYEIPDELGGRPASAAGNGELLSTTPVAGDRSVWSWTQTRPMATELAMVAIGVFDVTESTVTLAGSGRTVPAWTFIHQDLTDGARGRAVELNGRLAEILASLEAAYGPYPGGSTGFVLGITNVGYALETQDRPYFEQDVDPSTAVHEFAHQWFGDSVTPTDWNGIWLNEGPATYTEARYSHDVDPGAPTAEEVFFDEWATTDVDTGLWDVAPAAMTDPTQLYGWQSYERGAMTLAALHDLVGDATFDTILQTWTSRFAGQSVTNAQIEGLFSEFTGRDFAPFFEEWSYTAAKPAWPAVWRYGVSTPGARQDSATGVARATFTLSVDNVGRVPLVGAVVTADVTAVLDEATIAGDLGPGLSLQGSVVSWTVPETAPGAQATTGFTAVRSVAGAGARLAAAVSADPAALGADCADSCTAAVTVTGVLPATGAEPWTLAASVAATLAIVAGLTLALVRRASMRRRAATGVSEPADERDRAPRTAAGHAAGGGGQTGLAASASRNCSTVQGRPASGAVSPAAGAALDAIAASSHAR